MKNGFLSFALVALASFTSTATASWDLIKSETGNHCVDQGLGHLRFLFGERVKVTSKFTETCHAGDSGCNTWLQTNLCTGYFVMETARGASCTSAHYGFVPMYVRRIWAFGDCQNIMKQDVYPRNDDTDPYIRRPQ